jgi:hypothetical protein
MGLDTSRPACLAARSAQIGWVRRNTASATTSGQHQERDSRPQMGPKFTRRGFVKLPTRSLPAFWLAVLLAGCASLASPPGREDSGWLTLTISPERSQPGCPILVRLHMRPGGLGILRGELRWRVAHGRSVRDGVVPLPLPPVARDAGDPEAEVAFKPPGAGTYRIEVWVEDATGRMSTVTSRHDVAHVGPLAAPPVCDAGASMPQETAP